MRATPKRWRTLKVRLHPVDLLRVKQLARTSRDHCYESDLAREALRLGLDLLEDRRRDQEARERQI